MKKPASVSAARGDEAIATREKREKRSCGSYGGRASDRSGHGRDAWGLSALRLAPLAEISVDELPVPARVGRNAGGRWRRLRVFPGCEPHDPRRQGKLASRMEADCRFQPGPRRRGVRQGPRPHRDELLAARSQLLSPYRVL